MAKAEAQLAGHYRLLQAPSAAGSKEDKHLAGSSPALVVSRANGTDVSKHSSGCENGAPPASIVAKEGTGQDRLQNAQVPVSKKQAGHAAYRPPSEPSLQRGICKRQT